MRTTYAHKCTCVHRCVHACRNTTQIYSVRYSTLKTTSYMSVSPWALSVSTVSAQFLRSEKFSESTVSFSGAMVQPDEL